MSKLVDYTCPHCNARLQARRTSLGSVTRCKVCGGKVMLTPVFSKGCGCMSGLATLLGLGVAGFLILACLGMFIGRGSPVVENPPVRNQVADRPVEHPNLPAEKIAEAPVAPVQPADPTPANPVQPKIPDPAQTEWESLEQRLATEPITSKLKLDLEKFIVQFRGTPQEAKASVEMKAYHKMTLAKKLLDRDKKSEAREWLSDVKEEFPGTNAAREAQGILDKFP